MKNHQKNLLSVYSHALAAVNGTQAVHRYLPTLVMELKSYSPTLANLANIDVIAIGKAAEAMLNGVLDNNQLSINSALLISKHGHISTKSYNNPIIHCMEADHPVPNDASLQAGKTLLSYIAQLPKDNTCIVLISGGTSSLVEVLEEHWHLDELQALTQWMLANAIRIDAMNAVRSRVSSIKGGGLWRYFLSSSPLKQVCCLLISDVPSDDKRVIGSGLLFPAINTAIPPTLPKKWQHKLAQHTYIPIPNHFSSVIIANNKQAQHAAVLKAQQLGYQVICDYEVLESDAVTIAQRCVQCLRDHRGKIIIWGAETTVNLPAIAGKGGRNQHLALAAALEMEKNQDSNILLLAAGTDGSDGVTDDAGGFVNEHTVSLAKNKGWNAKIALKNANANPLLQAINALIITGVTGTNVMDLIIGYAHE